MSDPVTGMFLTSMLLLIASVAAQTNSTVVVKPDDMRVYYTVLATPNLPNLNLQKYSERPGAAWIPLCNGVVVLANATDSVSLVFTGSSLQVNFMSDATGGKAIVSLGAEPTEQSLVDTQNSSANVRQNNCQVTSITKSGLDTGVHNLEVKVVSGPVFLSSFSYVTNTLRLPPTSQPPVPIGDVQVLMNNSDLVYGDQHVPLGAWEPTICGSYVNLWNTGDHVSMAFNGTAIAINVLRTWFNGMANIYVDGNLLQSVDNYGPADPLGLECDHFTIRKSGLTSGLHNVSIVTTQRSPGAWFLVQSLVYTPSEPPSSAVATQKKTNGPLIGGVAGGLAGALLFATIIFLVLRRKRRETQSVAAFDEAQDLSPRGDKPSEVGVQAPALDGVALVEINPPSTTGIIAPEAKAMTTTTSQRNLQIFEDPPAYPPSPPPIQPSPTQPQNRLDIIQRLLDRDVPSSEIAAVIRMMENQPAGPSTAGLPAPSYDFKDQ